MRRTRPERTVRRCARPAYATLTLLVLCGAAPPVRAQAAAVLRDSVPSDSACPYVRCALGIAPVWNGLAVVRGARGEPVATLGFFRARALPLFAGHDSAAHYATRAVRVRGVASALTDGGALMLAVGAARALGAGRLDRGGRVLVAAGAATLGVSVPFHLSRAVWWYNAALR